MQFLKGLIVLHITKDKLSIVAKKSYNVGNCGVSLSMNDVLFEPYLRDDLLSVWKLINSLGASLKVRLCGTNAVIRDGKGLIAIAYERGGLSEIDIEIKQCSLTYEVPLIEQLRTDLDSLSVRDDFFHFAIVYPIKKKSEIFESMMDGNSSELEEECEIF